MAKVVNIFSSMDEDMKDYHKKIWKHRTAQIVKGIAVILAVLAVGWGIRHYMQNKTFTSYSISSSVQRNDTLTTKYASFGEKILKYSRDGVSYTDEGDDLLFSITYTMQDPMLALSEKTGVVADKNGSQIYIFDQEKQLGQITTLLPIKRIAVSNQGIVAVLLEESDAAKLEIYSSDGTLIGDGVFSLEDVGYPLDLSISRDGTKIALSFAQVVGSKLGSSVAVYNFDSVGENHVDHLVFAKNYTDSIISELHYFDASTLTAVGDGVLAFYQGTQIPEPVNEITFEDEIKGVFYGQEKIGLVFGASEGHLLKVYDLDGNLVSEITTDLEYENIRIFDKGVVVYRDTEMALYSEAGKERYRQTFDDPMIELFTTKSAKKYLLIYTNETQMIKLQ